MTKKILILSASVCILAHSCIKPEAPNMEADIMQVNIADSLTNGAPIIANNYIAVYIKKDKINRDSFALNFDITPGATITPASGSVQNFNTAVTYTVTSEDKRYQKIYTVNLIDESVPDYFSFEHYEYDASKNYTIFYEDLQTSQNIWGSGNAGFATLAGNNPTPTDYPSQAITDPNIVKDGQAALKLVTTSTGSLGQMVKMPIAAGSLFIGSLDITNQFNPVTKMGLPFNKVPISLTGYYQYKPGSVLIDKDNQVLTGSDECNIYAVLYDRNILLQHKQVSWLSNDNILNDESIVAIAQLASGKATDGDRLVPFDIPFTYIKSIDPNAVKAFNYNIALVFSSSKYGDLYQGAISSTLIVDAVKIVVE